MKPFVRAGVIALVFGVLAGGLTHVSRVEGQRRGNLRAQIYMTQARVPANLTERSLIGFVRGHNARRLVETTEEALNERKWLAEMVIAFNTAPGDLEFHVLFYDVTDGARRFIDDMSTYVNDSRQKTFLQRIRLARPQFAPNRRLELVVTVQRAEVGRIQVDTIGEEVRRSGRVDFSDEDTRQRDDGN